MLEPSLSVTLTPRHSIVGIEAPIATIQVNINVQAGELQSDDRSPIDLIVALDCSDSMAGSQLQLCKTTLERIVRFLLPTDRFGLVSFADDALIEVPAQKMTAENKRAALIKISSLYTRGCTNISAAIGVAAHEMRCIEEPNEVRAIFLLTDGLPNQGLTDSAWLNLQRTALCWIIPLTSRRSTAYRCRARLLLARSTASHARRQFVRPLNLCLLRRRGVAMCLPALPPAHQSNFTALDTESATQHPCDYGNPWWYLLLCRKGQERRRSFWRCLRRSHVFGCAECYHQHFGAAGGSSNGSDRFGCVPRRKDQTRRWFLQCHNWRFLCGREPRCRRRGQVGHPR